jgi:hypothetical protein
MTLKGHNMRRKFASALLALVVMGALAFSSVAIAADPAENAYGGLANEQQAAAEQNVAAAQSGGTLPFTGFQLGIALVAGVALVGTGLVLRRASRDNAV